MYLFCESSIIDALWSGEDVIITGREAGASYIKFASDAEGSLDAFIIAVLCYE